MLIKPVRKASRGHKLKRTKVQKIKKEAIHSENLKIKGPKKMLCGSF